MPAALWHVERRCSQAVAMSLEETGSRRENEKTSIVLDWWHSRAMPLGKASLQKILEVYLVPI